MSIRIFLLGLALAIAGCATNYADAPASEVAAAVEIRKTAFDASPQYVGPVLASRASHGLFSGEGRRVRLRSDGPNSHHIYLEISYSASDWRFYRWADFDKGWPARLRVIDRRVLSCQVYDYLPAQCSHVEIMVIPLAEPQIAAMREQDLNIRLRSLSGVESIVTIPATYTTGYLLALHET